MKKYFSMAVDNTARSADINIYGDITSYPWTEADVSAYNLSKQIEELKDIDTINIYINSYGGEVAEGLAIYNALKRHKARVKTFVDGFACSIASVIFMAGDTREMARASLLMIHNAWTYAEGNADELRKQANDLDVITTASKAAYLECINISEVKLKHLMDAETWITPADAVTMGFATGIVEDGARAAVNQSAKKRVYDALRALSAEDAKTDDGAENGAENGNKAAEDVTQTANTDENTVKTPEKEDENGTKDPENDGENAENKENTAILSGFFNSILKM